jgi:dipeptidyl aminopeptidase/acylaminoacyl peptidase
MPLTNTRAARTARRDRRARQVAVAIAAASLAGSALPSLARAQSAKPTIAQFLSPSSPQEVNAARRADRIAWVSYERGMRNVYTAAAPRFTPVRLTSFMKDDGIEVSDVHLSDDGRVAIFIRGSAPNREGWVADPEHDPNGSERAIWAVRTTGGPAWRLAEGSNPELSPDGKTVIYLKGGQIYRVRVMNPVPRDSMDLGLKPFVNEWGSQSDATWSPDGSRIAFVSARLNHALIGVYDMRTRSISFMAPSVDCDASPVWSPDSKQIAFTRRPGVPYGEQAQAGGGGIGFPAGAAFNPQAVVQAAARGRESSAFSGCRAGFGRFGGGGGGGGARGAGNQGRGNDTASHAPSGPGWYNATFRGGYTLSLMVADVATGTARELWHNQPKDRGFAGISRLQWGGDNIVFPLNPQGDEWERYFSINVTHPAKDPVMLTTTNGLIEDATSEALSSDGKTLYYCTNANDIEKRHIWAVPTAGGTPVQVSTDDGVETYPQPLASGRQLAVLYFNAAQPASIGIVPTSGGNTRIVFPTLNRDFPQSAHVTPQIVITKAADGTEIHNQIFLPRDLKPGERRPAIIFVHGGPVRQMLPAYHYMQFYHWAYAFNQWLQSQGYVVMSINYRGGVGYGRSFRSARNTNARGNSEYQDVLAGAKYLQSRADVDSTRIGIWGLSYGGLLTSEALARNSDIFVAGADLAGVHLYTPTLDTTATAFESSAAAHVDTWRSPVFLVQGDDDRNVDFSQMVGLVDLLRPRNVYYELTVIPDDVHESLVHSRWVDIFTREGAFLHRFVWDREPAPVVTSTGR